MSSDRELLEKAAKAAGIVGEWSTTMGGWPCLIVAGAHAWQPMHDDGDALRLLIKLQMHINWAFGNETYICVSGGDEAEESVSGGDPMAATRRAIVRAAAALADATPSSDGRKA